MDNLDFSEEEIQEQLSILGYKNIPKHRLLEFKQDLDALISGGGWKSLKFANPTITKSQTACSQPSPPPYTIEKVIQDSAKGHYADKGNYDRLLPSTHGDRNRQWQQEHDSYAQHSVAQKLHIPPSASGRLEVEADLEETLSDSVTLPPGTQKRCLIKRKVLRKHKGQSLVCDESVYSEEDSETASHLEERLAELGLSTSAQRAFEEEEEEEMVSSKSDVQSNEADTDSLSAFESYIRGMAGTQSGRDLRPKPKSFIRPVMSQQTIKKTDPVAKYFQYKQLWDMFKLRGEKDRKSLRLEVKERLAHQPPPPKPRRVFVPNTYIVPTEKKRSALRWEIRSDLANGFLPHAFSYQG